MNEVATSNQRSSLSRAALICGICGFIPAVGLAAIICAIVDLVKIKNNESSPLGKGWDIMGIVLPIVWGLIIIICVVAITSCIALGAGQAVLKSLTTS